MHGGNHGGRGRAPRWVLGVALAVVTAALFDPGLAGSADAGDPPPLVISHRGASADAPEHTFAAYDRAIEQRTDVLECDLQLTADDVLVCVHDTTVDRTTGGTATGRVESFTLEQLRAMDFGSWFGPEFAGARIVPFEEQLRCYRKTAPGVQFYAETKAPAEYGGRMEPALVDLLRRLDLVPEGRADPRRAPVIIQSFDLASLDAVKRLAPSLPTAWLWVVPPPESSGGGTPPSSVDVMAPTAAYVAANPDLVDQVHAAGGEVHTWTVDDPAAMDQLLDDGVDGVFSNETATLRERVDAHTGRGARPTVDLERGCSGVAGTVTASTGDSPASSTRPADGGTGAAPGDASDESGSTPWAAIAVGVVVIGALAGFGAWRLQRRRT